MYMGEEAYQGIAELCIWVKRLTKELLNCVYG